MPTVELLRVSQATDLPPELVRSEVEADLPAGWDHFALPVSGTVELRAGAPSVRRVELRWRGGLVHAAAVRNDRFELLAGVIGLPADFELSVVAVLHDKRDIEIGSVSAHHEPVQSGFEPKLQPLMVTSLGRTGSTLLMRMLAAHDGVLVQGRFPYELWPARYWMHAFKVLTHPRDAVRSADAYGFDRDELRLGPNPFYLPRVTRRAEGALLGRAYAQSLAATFQAQVDGWYGTVAREQDAAGARYFGEKHLLRPNGTQDVTWELYPQAREVFLVRNFRDIASSAVDFSNKRGRPMMGWTGGKSAEEYVREDLRASALEFSAAWQRRRETAHLVRYEDLIRKPAETLAGMLEYLGLDRAPTTIERLTREGHRTDVDPAHLTSASAAASIGRWRQESDTTLRGAMAETFSELLPEFGYDD